MLGVRGRTLFDWVAALALPTVVGVGTLVVSAGQIELEARRSSEAVVQAYIDRISTLVLNAEMASRPDTFAAVGTGQTAAVLAQIGPEQAGRILTFLGGIGHLETFLPSLEGLDLSGAELKGLDLRRLDFEGAILAGADLEGADLREADFEEADLTGADLKEADLRGVDFDGTILDGADLSGARLSGTDLSEATGLTADQLSAACFDETLTLPANLRVTPRCESMEDDDD